MFEKVFESTVETLKACLCSLIWGFITIALPVLVAIHLNHVYGLKDSTLLLCIGWWWYMVVSGSDRVSAWVEAKLNLKERTKHDRNRNQIRH